MVISQVKHIKTKIMYAYNILEAALAYIPNIYCRWKRGWAFYGHLKLVNLFFARFNS